MGYHEDTVKKRKITKEEIEFLKELQKEMNTQDHVSQADPRFWVVATDKYQIPGDIDSCDGMQLYDSSDCEIVCDGDIPSMIEYINEHFEDSTKLMIIKEEDNLWKASYIGDDESEPEAIYSPEDFLEFLQDHHILSDSYEFVYYRNVHYNYPNTMFLTNRSCKEHIKANHYHYNDDAHSYAMTAWRSPEVEKLYKILQEIDWDSLA